MAEKFVAGATTTWRDYLQVDGKIVGERFCTGAAPCTASAAWTWFALDHLGSIVLVTNGAGAVVERDSDDAWGLRRNPNGTDAVCGSIVSVTTRNFTGHEMIDGACLVNMNARIYDPQIARFMTADPLNWLKWQKGSEDLRKKFNAHIANAQNYNVYSYAGNDPTVKTDPSGAIIALMGNSDEKQDLPAKVNSLANGQYAINDRGELYRSGDSKSGSAYYANRLDAAIASSRTIQIGFKQTITVNDQGRTVEVPIDKLGGGTTVRQSYGAATAISGNDAPMQKADGKMTTMKSAEVLMHELLGHAIPIIVGTDSGNAVVNENRARMEIPGLSQRMIDSDHKECGNVACQ